MIRFTLTLLDEFGSVCLFFKKAIHTFFVTRGNFQAIMAQVSSISIRSLSTVIFAGIFVGAILVLQFNLILEKYDAQSFLGGLNTSAVFREVGPMIISFLLAGKIGAYTAAELGTMRVTEQIEAIECLGTDPIQYLVVPRLLGIILSSLILLFIGLLVSIVSAMAVAHFACEVNFLEFITSIPKFTSQWTVFSGMLKCLIYGTIVGAVSCHQGFSAKGGARGVGRAVTLAAVYTNFYIVIAQYLANHFFHFAENLTQIMRGGSI